MRSCSRLLECHEIVVELIQAALPERALPGEPSFGKSEAPRDEAINAHAPDLPGPHQPATLQDSEMIEEGGQRHGKRGGELADRAGAAAKPREHPPARGIGESAKNAVDGRGIETRSSFAGGSWVHGGDLAADQYLGKCLSDNGEPSGGSAVR